MPHNTYKLPLTPYKPTVTMRATTIAIHGRSKQCKTKGSLMSSHSSSSAFRWILSTILGFLLILKRNPCDPSNEAMPTPSTTAWMWCPITDVDLVEPNGNSIMLDILEASRHVYEKKRIKHWKDPGRCRVFGVSRGQGTQNSVKRHSHAVLVD